MAELNLTTIGNGIAIEKFNSELQKVLKNILDPNTVPNAKRSISLTVTVKPTSDRKFGTMNVETSVKLAPDIAYASRAFFGQLKDGRVAAFEDNPDQLTINDFRLLADKVVQLQSAKGEAAK